MSDLKQDDDTNNTAGDNSGLSVLNNKRPININNSNTSVPYGFQRHKYPSIVEFILLFWVFTLFIEEIRQVTIIFV